MAFTIQDLIHQKIFPGVKLMAGSKGLRNEILWVNIMEILDTPKSVQSGELLFTTGYGLQYEERHKELIPQLAKRGVSGIAIQVGYYIDSIPNYILNQADALDFPVLLVPKNLTFSEILHTMTRIIAPEGKKDWSDAVINQASVLLAEDLKQYQDAVTPDNEGQCVQVLLLEAVNYTSVEKEEWHKSLAEICSLIQAHSSISLYHELPRHRYVFLTAHPSIEDFLSMLYQLGIKLTLLSEASGSNYYLGAERLYSRDGLAFTLAHATDALSTLQLVQARRGVCFYDHIKFIKMFGHMHSKDSSIVLDNQPLQRLLNHDRVNNTNYVQTLRVYLSNNCNMTRTARQLFLHRHTLIKRLEKISDVAGLNLNDYYTRIYMSVALLFHDYFVY